MSRFELSDIDQQKLSQMCKPCPFCASIFIYVGPMHALGYGVKCMSCKARTRNFDLPEYSTKRHIAQRLCWRAVQAWNTRAAETPTLGVPQVRADTPCDRWSPSTTDPKDKTSTCVYCGWKPEDHDPELQPKPDESFEGYLQRLAHKAEAVWRKRGNWPPGTTFAFHIPYRIGQDLLRLLWQDETGKYDREQGLCSKPQTAYEDFKKEFQHLWGWLARWDADRFGIFPI